MTSALRGRAFPKYASYIICIRLAFDFTSTAGSETFHPLGTLNSTEKIASLVLFRLSAHC
jgi:hypothetical protein